MIAKELSQDSLKVYANLWFKDFLVFLLFVAMTIVWIFYSPFEMEGMFDYIAYYVSTIILILSNFMMWPEEEYALISAKDKTVRRIKKVLWFKPDVYVTSLDEDSYIDTEESKNKVRVGIRMNDGTFFPFSSFYLKKSLVGDIIESIENFLQKSKSD